MCMAAQFSVHSNNGCEDEKTKKRTAVFTTIRFFLVGYNESICAVQVPVILSRFAVLV
jgi:hypothetical protein